MICNHGIGYVVSHLVELSKWVLEVERLLCFLSLLWWSTLYKSCSIGNKSELKILNGFGCLVLNNCSTVTLNFTQFKVANSNKASPVRRNRRVFFLILELNVLDWVLVLQLSFRHFWDTLLIIVYMSLSPADLSMLSFKIKQKRLRHFSIQHLIGEGGWVSQRCTLPAAL